MELTPEIIRQRIAQTIEDEKQILSTIQELQGQVQARMADRQMIRGRRIELQMLLNELAKPPQDVAAEPEAAEQDADAAPDAGD